MSLLEEWTEQTAMPVEEFRKKFGRRKHEGTAIAWDVNRILDAASSHSIVSWEVEDFARLFAKTANVDPEDPNTLKSVRRLLSRLSKKHGFQYEIVSGIVTIYGGKKNGNREDGENS